MQELNSGFKIATSAVILCFILAISITLMLIGRNLWNRVATEVERPISSITDTDAYYLASYGKPVPVAGIWKLVQRVNMNNVSGGNGNLYSFVLREQSPSNPNTYITRSLSIDSLEDYMNRKAYLSWSLDETTGLYAVEVLVLL